MRLFSVTEELLPVDPVVLRPAPLKAEMVMRYGHGWRPLTPWEGAAETHDVVSVALLRDQIQVVGPQQSSLAGLLETVRIGRALADRAARAQERRAVVLASPVFPVAPVEAAMSGRSTPDGGPAWAGDFSTCGLNVHIVLESPEEGVQVLDRLRIWLPVLLALSANSPFWRGIPTRFSSHRYFSRAIWPAPGPSPIFGSADEYERQRRHQIQPPATRFARRATWDAQLSPTREALDVLLTDACMDPEHAAVVAAITRALVEVSARQWRRGTPPVPTSVVDLRASSWLAALNGLDGKLMSPHSARMRSASGVVDELLQLVHPVLQEYHEGEHTRAVIDDMLRHGTGSRKQRDAYAGRRDLHDVVEVALRGTHDPNHVHGIPGAILAESWALTDTEEATHRPWGENAHGGSGG